MDFSDYKCPTLLLVLATLTFLIKRYFFESNCTHIAVHHNLQEIIFYIHESPRESVN